MSSVKRVIYAGPHQEAQETNVRLGKERGAAINAFVAAAEALATADPSGHAYVTESPRLLADLRAAYQAKKDAEAALVEFMRSPEHSAMSAYFVSVAETKKKAARSAAPDTPFPRRETRLEAIVNTQRRSNGGIIRLESGDGR